MFVSNIKRNILLLDELVKTSALSCSRLYKTFIDVNSIPMTDLNVAEVDQAVAGPTRSQ